MSVPDVVSTAASHGWFGLAALLVLSCRAQLRMLVQRAVFFVFRTSTDEQNKWLIRELNRERGLALARAFFSRTRKQRTSPNPPGLGEEPRKFPRELE